MNITEIKATLPILMRNRVVPFLWGQQGMGKTQVIKQLAKEQGMGFMHLHLATQEVGDLVGLLIQNSDGTVRHARPEWFPTEGKGIIFLDEFNRAMPDVLQVMLPFVNEGTIHTHKLPPGWAVVCAGNYASNAFNVTDTSDAALTSRFCHLDFLPTKEEFTVFAESKKMFSVVDFISENPEMLEVNHKDKMNTSMITPDRRSWIDMIGVLDNEIALDPVRYEVYSGIVGPTAAASYQTWKKKSEERLRGRDVLNTYPRVRPRVLAASDSKSPRFDLLNTAVEEVMLLLNDKTTPDMVDNFKAFMLDVPLELGLKIHKRLKEVAWADKGLILNNKEFVAKFKVTKLGKGTAA